ncbi:MAG: hypothetical protein H0W39_06365 [Sphingomonas sp.]|nr:hypothetical protein [Sphingomonas sp.]
MAISADERRTPIHLWIVGALALVWNAIGAFDYVMTRTRDMDYLSQMPGVDAQAMIAWIEAFPIWAQFGWGLGVWMGLLGSVLLLARSRWAVWAFILSFVGILLGIGYQIAGAPPLAGAEGALHLLMPFAVIAIGLFLLFYSWRNAKKGVLR